MDDDYVARYQGLSHQQLYDMLMAGHPGDVENLAASWSSRRDDANNLATTLDADLTSLSQAWEGPAFDEFRRRVSAISTFATTLANEFDSVRSGLTLLSGPLREAQQQAESPAATDDHDSLVSGAAKGAAAGSVLGPVGTVGGAVLGGVFGHNQDEAEKQAAHQRMISLVAGLAVNYDLTSENRWTAPESPPDGLPGGVSSISGLDAGSTGGITPHAVHGTGTATYQTGTGGDTTTPGQAPLSGDASTSLLGAGGLAGVDASAPASSGTAGGGSSGAGGGSSGSLVAGAAALAGTGLAASVQGAGPGRAGTGSLTSGARPPAGTDGVIGRTDANRAATGIGSKGGRPHAVGPGLAGTGEDEPDERTTWLTEDDMDWGGGDAPPAVFGHPANTDDAAAADGDGDQRADTQPDNATDTGTRAVADGTVAAR
jgi:uncharacterized protein YukE